MDFYHDELLGRGAWAIVDGMLCVACWRCGRRFELPATKYTVDEAGVVSSAIRGPRCRSECSRQLLGWTGVDHG